MIPTRDTIPTRQTPIVTWALIFVNVAVFLYELTLDPKELERLFYLFGMVPARYTHPDWAMLVGFPIDDYWPFLTSMFLHGGFMHVIGNMWTLWIFGDKVEDRMGRAHFLIFYLLTGLAAGLTHFQVPAVLYLLFWALSRVVSGTLAGLGPEDVGGGAWWAHVGGFVAGMALCWFFLLPRRDAPGPFARDEYGVEQAWSR
jgi:membrane associated rhomboid family serine protease